ncbi:MAG: hypothetical protein PWR21_509 [Methanoculleus sp.]|nr:hypothetical protein [Methanoculleus sp.]MDK2989192.1 hypothetical protein [Methanoculleus sp.]
MAPHSGEPESSSRTGAGAGGQRPLAAGERPVHERMAELLAENAALRRENAALQSLKDALQESEERYRRLFEDDLTGDFLTGVDGRILACNPAFVRMFGFASIEDALDTDIRDLYEDPGDRDLLLARLRREGKIENEGRTRKRRDGTRIHVVENMVGRFGPDGELIETQGYVYDDSERRRAEEEIKRHAAELARIHRDLESAHREANLYLDILTHDIGNTENVSNLYAELLIDSLEGAAFVFTLRQADGVPARP